MTIWSAEIKELEILSKSINVHLPDLEKELDRLIKSDDENMVLLYARRCLEVIITDLCECELKRPRKTEPLKGIIDKLNKEQRVPSHIITSMDHLNSLSAYGAHPKDFDPRQVKPVLNNLTIIIEWYLKYKDTQTTSTSKPEEAKYESKVPDTAPDKTRKSKRKLIVTVSGIILVIIIAIGALFLFNVIGERKQAETVAELEKSIAVLPFHNYSGDPNQEYMSDGLTDEIINHLYKIASFDKVVSLNSVLTYKGTEKRLPQIANELQVNYILEGTYKKIGDSVRVTAQLIEPKKDKHLWQNEYDRLYKEIIAIQADIAFQIADQVKAFITDSEKKNIQKIPTTNQEAYDLMQQAYHLWNPRNYSLIDKVIELILKAIELDPDYADAYAWAGIGILLKGNYGGGSEMQSVVWDAVPYFEKALELDQNNGTAHFGMAWFNDWIRWDYVRAEKEYLKAVALEPNNQTFLNSYSEFLIKMNRQESALILEANKILTQSTLKLYILSGKIKDVYDSINRYLERGEDQVYKWVAEDYIWLEEYDSAKLYLESALKSEDPQMLIPRFQAYLALVNYKTKNNQQARVIINQLINQSNKTSAGSPDYFTGWYFSGIGEADSAFYWLEKAYKNRSPEMPWLKVDPVFKSLKSDDRYWDLYARTGHKAYDEYMEGRKQ